MRQKLALLCLACIVGLLAGAAPATAADSPITITGTRGGANFQIQVPRPWNGTLVLWSHGYEAPGGPRGIPSVAPGDVVQRWLLDHGYALAASGYSQQGWALEQAFHDQMDLVEYFDTLGFGQARRTIAWGASLGGIITAGLLQLHPERFAGAIPLCGVLAGGVGAWNEALDGAWVFKTLTAPDSALQVVNITNPLGNFQLAATLLAAAQATPQGRARLALAAAVGDVPGWYTPGSPQPDRRDFASRQQNQFRWLQNPDFFFQFALRQELELRAGGNPSWNVGVDYARQLALSTGHDLVRALYLEAGLSLEDDLKVLADTPRIAAAPQAVAYLTRFIAFNGEIRQPVLTMHTTADGLVPDQHEQAYASVVRAAGNEQLLRQAFVERAGHCSFTPAELLAAFTTLVTRVDSGQWTDDATPESLNATAAALNVGPSEFVHHHSTDFLRPFDVRAVPAEVARAA